MTSFFASMALLRLVLFLPLAALSACVTRPGARPASRVSAAPTAAAGPNTVGPWRPGVSYARQSVTIATHAVVVISGSSATRTDTLDATLGASYNWALEGRRRVTGTLTDYRVAAGNAAPAVPTGLALGRPFTADASLIDGSLEFSFPTEGSVCTDPMLSALQGLHDAWIPLTDTLSIGREWSDTVRTLSCRDRLPVRGVIVRRFRVQRADVENGRVVLTIDRHSKGRVTAEGEQFGESVTLGGEADGAMRYVLDVASGRLVRASGKASLDLAFKSRLRNQRVRQDSELTLVWTP